jgi:hypothetical protein
MYSCLGDILFILPKPYSIPYPVRRKARKGSKYCTYRDGPACDCFLFINDGTRTLSSPA